VPAYQQAALSLQQALSQGEQLTLIYRSSIVPLRWQIQASCNGEQLASQ
jgi:hypothetical protein